MARASEIGGIGERAIREWFGEALVTPQGLRAEVLDGPAGDAAKKSLPSLLDAYLIREDRRRGATWYELAHDRLIRPVRESNAEWFGANLNVLQTQARAWEEHNRAREFLLADGPLKSAARWASAHRAEVTPLERSLLDTSLRLRRIRQAIAMGSALAILMLVVLAAWMKTSSADQRAFRAAQAEETARQAKTAAVEELAQVERRWQNLVESTLRSYGWIGPISADDAPRILQSLAAGREWPRALSASASERRRLITIQYPERPGEEATQSLLSDLDFRVIPTPRLPGDCPAPNRVLCGRRVDVPEAHLVALTLVRAGIEIRQVQRLGGVEQSASLIRLDCDASLLRQPDLGIERLTAELAGETATEADSTASMSPPSGAPAAPPSPPPPPASARGLEPGAEGARGGAVAVRPPEATLTPPAPERATPAEPRRPAPGAPPVEGDAPSFPLDPAFRIVAEQAMDLLGQLGPATGPLTDDAVTWQAFDGITLARCRHWSGIYAFAHDDASWFRMNDPKIDPDLVASTLLYVKNPRKEFFSPASSFTRAWLQYDLEKKVGWPQGPEMTAGKVMVQSFANGLIARDFPDFRNPNPRMQRTLTKGTVAVLVGRGRGIVRTFIVPPSPPATRR